MDINHLLDETAQALGVRTNYALAKRLGIPNPRIYDYRSGRMTPDAYAATRIALALGRDPLALIAEIEAEGARTEAQRSFWRDFLSAAGRSGRTLGALLLTCAVLWSAEPQAGGPQGGLRAA